MARKCSVSTELSCGVGTRTYPADIGQRFTEGRQLTAQVHVVEEVVGVDGRHRHLSTTQTRGLIVQLRLLTASELLLEVHAFTHNSQMSILLYVLTPLAVADVVGAFAPRLPHEVVDALRQRVVDEVGAEHAQTAGGAHQPLHVDVAQADDEHCATAHPID